MVSGTESFRKINGVMHDQDLPLCYSKDLLSCTADMKQAAQNYIDSGLPQLIRMFSCWPENADYRIETSSSELNQALTSYTKIDKFRIPKKDPKANKPSTDTHKNKRNDARPGKAFFRSNFQLNIPECLRDDLEAIDGTKDYVSVHLNWGKSEEKSMDNGTTTIFGDNAEIFIFSNGIIVFSGKNADVMQLSNQGGQFKNTKDAVSDMFFGMIKNPHIEKNTKQHRSKTDSFLEMRKRKRKERFDEAKRIHKEEYPNHIKRTKQAMFHFANSGLSFLFANLPDADIQVNTPFIKFSELLYYHISKFKGNITISPSTTEMRFLLHPLTQKVLNMIEEQTDEPYRPWERRANQLPRVKLPEEVKGCGDYVHVSADFGRTKEMRRQHGENVMFDCADHIEAYVFPNGIALLIGKEHKVIQLSGNPEISLLAIKDPFNKIRENPQRISYYVPYTDTHETVVVRTLGKESSHTNIIPSREEKELVLTQK